MAQDASKKKKRLVENAKYCDAGQSVVQFARKAGENAMTLFALKFFAAREDYLQEVDVYRNSPLRSFMPSVLLYESNNDTSIRDPFGGVMPPFIVMEKGESLQERVTKSRVDVFTVAQVLFKAFPAESKMLLCCWGASL
jgi:hypothetical protein